MSLSNTFAHKGGQFIRYPKGIAVFLSNIYKILNTNTSKEDTNYAINNQNEDVIYIVQAPSSDPEVY